MEEPAPVKARVAVIEDNPDSRLLFRVILERVYRVCDYASGEAALHAMPGEPPDLILLDVSLPGIDGLGVLARIRDDPELRRIPVVALTAHAMASDRQRFLEHGFDDYLAKPVVDESELFSLIERHLSSDPTS